MRLSENEKRQELAKEILTYFLRNPEAADTLEGVAHWRLLDQFIHRKVQETSEALDWLVSRGYLLQNSTTASERIFQLNHRKRDDALVFVNTEERHQGLE